MGPAIVFVTRYKTTKLDSAIAPLQKGIQSLGDKKTENIISSFC